MFSEYGINTSVVILDVRTENKFQAIYSTFIYSFYKNLARASYEILFSYLWTRLSPRSIFIDFPSPLPPGTARRRDEIGLSAYDRWNDETQCLDRCIQRGWEAVDGWMADWRCMCHICENLIMACSRWVASRGATNREMLAWNNETR